MPCVQYRLDRHGLEPRALERVAQGVRGKVPQVTGGVTPAPIAAENACVPGIDVGDLAEEPTRRPEDPSDLSQCPGWIHHVLEHVLEHDDVRRLRRHVSMLEFAAPYADPASLGFVRRLWLVLDAPEPVAPEPTDCRQKLAGGAADIEDRASWGQIRREPFRRPAL